MQCAAWSDKYVGEAFHPVPSDEGFHLQICRPPPSSGDLSPSLSPGGRSRSTGSTGGSDHSHKVQRLTRSGRKWSKRRPGLGVRYLWSYRRELQAKTEKRDAHGAALLIVSLRLSYGFRWVLQRPPPMLSFAFSRNKWSHEGCYLDTVAPRARE